MAVEPLHRYSNKTERANSDIYDFKWEKILLVSMLGIKRFHRLKD